MKNEDIERILNYTTTMKSGTPYLEIVELIDEYKRQQKEIEDLKIRLQDTLSRQKNTLYFCIDDYVSKDKIRKFIKKELPDDELMECCKIYDVNGIDLRIKLEKILEEK